MQLVLTAVAGPHVGQTFTFTGHDRFLVGRSAKAHFRLRPSADRDLRISRLHFMVEVNPPLCCLYDMRSRNGTFVNGKRVAQAQLKHGDEVRAGHTVLKVSLHDPEQTAPWSGADETATPEPVAAPPAPPSVAVGGACLLCRTALPAGPPLCDACRGRAAARPQPIPGYLILATIGRGSMGVVYLALRTADGAALALKTIRPACPLKRGQVERFLREADILRSLDHPHIVAFRELGDAAGLLYFAMDYVPGTDASQLAHRVGRLEVREAVRLVGQVLQALEYAHAKGFVHRDVKPSNILLADDGRQTVKVADFGLGRVYRASQLSGLTLPDEVGGTVGYMPPEQITDYRNVSPAADQYSAAATLYRLLAGTHVYDQTGDVAARIDRILREEPVPLRARRPDLPAALAEAVHRALAREPQDRFPDVRLFRRALLPCAR
jgi:serine/threonine-protein kinase